MDATFTNEVLSINSELSISKIPNTAGTACVRALRGGLQTEHLLPSSGSAVPHVPQIAPGDINNSGEGNAVLRRVTAILRVKPGEESKGIPKQNVAFLEPHVHYNKVSAFDAAEREVWPRNIVYFVMNG